MLVTTVKKILNEFGQLLIKWNFSQDSLTFNKELITPTHNHIKIFSIPI